MLRAVLRCVALCVPLFNGHPPLGVNATYSTTREEMYGLLDEFQRAPTLGGECYRLERGTKIQ